VTAEEIIRDATEQLAALTADYERVCAELEQVRRELLIERARAGHPSTRPVTFTHPTLRDRLQIATDNCDPHGLRRPDLRLIGGQQ
jgi:molecular chaperone GrpE (heat shock protein)